MNTMKRIRFLKEIMTTKEFNEIKCNKETFEGSLELYDEAYIDSVFVFAINDKRFIIRKKDIVNLHIGWQKTLGQVSLQPELINPVYVEVESDGLLLVE